MANKVIDDSPPTKDAIAEASKHAVWDENGSQVSFGNLLKPSNPGGKLVMIFIRHYHCGMCQDYITELVNKIKPEQLEAAKVNLVIIGCGSWTLGKPYRKILDCPWPIYSSPGKEVYIDLGMTLRTLDRGKDVPSYAKRSFMAGIIGSISRGISMGKLANSGDIKQLGGEYVISEGPTFTFTHRMKHVRDHVEVVDLMKAAGIEASQAPTKTSEPKTAANPEPAQSTLSVKETSPAAEPSTTTPALVVPPSSTTEPTVTSTAPAPATASTV